MQLNEIYDRLEISCDVCEVGIVSLMDDLI